jgi:protocatechuate 3,4-dioxygenase beta subunit
MTSTDQPLADRRTFLRIGGIAVLGLAAAACADSDGASSSTSATQSPATSPSSTVESSTVESSTVGSSAVETIASGSAQTPFTAAVFESLGTCALMPEKTSGPFPLDEQFDRSDVTEGLPGQPMRLGLRVVDQSCAPVPGAKVEIWHTDSTGDYSAFIDNGGGKDDGPGTTFMRGTQTANDEGIVEFLTVYPGWYSGRAVHIHLRVHLADATVLTSQMFFDDDYTASVYASAPYAEFGLPDTPNASDNIAGNTEAEGTLLHTSAGETSKGAGTVALLNLGITV